MSILDSKQLRASTACIEFFHHTGTVQHSIADLVKASNTTTRTFHRWFPRKEQVIRPYYAVISQRYIDSILAVPRPSIETTIDAWTNSALRGDTFDQARLYRLFRNDISYWSAFLEVLQDGEEILFLALKEKLPHSTNAELYASSASLVAASRLAFEANMKTNRNIVEAFSELLTAFDPIVFRTR